jgi:probable phosphoglycerate mutase
MDSKRKGRDFIARHGETVFNAAGRMQGNDGHTPLTRAGFAQADAMGTAMRALLGAEPALTLWSSSAGRALQTLAVVAEHLDFDWHAARVDDRLVEIDVGDWTGRYYRDVLAERGVEDTPEARVGLFRNRPPGGEWYDAIAARLKRWLADTADDPGDRLIVMHGISSRVLRGLMTGYEAEPCFGAPIAPALPQGSLVMIEGGVETVAHRGRGHG